MQHLFRDPWSLIHHSFSVVSRRGVQVPPCHGCSVLKCSKLPLGSSLQIWIKLFFFMPLKYRHNKMAFWLWSRSLRSMNVFKQCLQKMPRWYIFLVCFLFLWWATWMLVWKSVNLLFLPGDVFGWFSVRHEKFCSRGLSVEIWAPFPALELSELHA